MCFNACIFDVWFILSIIKCKLLSLHSTIYCIMMILYSYLFINSLVFKCVIEWMIPNLGVSLKNESNPMPLYPLFLVFLVSKTMVDLRAFCVVNLDCKGRCWKRKAMIDGVSFDQIFWNTLKRVLNWSFKYMIFYPSRRNDWIFFSCILYKINKWILCGWSRKWRLRQWTWSRINR